MLNKTKQNKTKQRNKLSSRIKKKYITAHIKEFCVQNKTKQNKTKEQIINSN